MARWQSHKVIFISRRHGDDNLHETEMRSYGHKTAAGAVEGCRKNWRVINADIVSLKSVKLISHGEAPYA